MIRTSVLRNVLFKSALKKDAQPIKVIRFLTVLRKPHCKRPTSRNEDFGALGVQVIKSNPVYRFYSNYPSHVKVTLPALSPTMEFGTIVTWEKKEGDKLNEGDLLAEIETDKATMGFETPEEGYLAKILIPAGSKNVPIGKLVCIIVENESDVIAFKDYADTETSAKASPVSAPHSPPPPPPLTPAAQPPTPKSAPAPVAAPPTQPGERIYASPLARKIAEEKGISLKNIGKGSGIYSSITSQDLKGAASARPIPVEQYGAQAFLDMPLNSMNSDLAKRVLHSKQTVPHYYLSVDINIDKVLSLKEKLNNLLAKDNMSISVHDFVFKAVALSCKKVPDVNSSWHETFIRQYNTVDICISVNTAKGLLTPIVFDADIKGLATISSEIKQLTAKAEQGTLQPEECQGGTISVTNLSSFGVRNVTAVIIPPQVCNLSLGAPEEKVVEDKSVGCGFRTCQFLPVTLSCDHRVVDGAVGAQWLAAFKQYMEDPTKMLL